MPAFSGADFQCLPGIVCVFSGLPVPETIRDYLDLSKAANGSLNLFSSLFLIVYLDKVGHGGRKRKTSRTKGINSRVLITPTKTSQETNEITLKVRSLNVKAR